jgi:hypothetical protein
MLTLTAVFLSLSSRNLDLLACQEVWDPTKMAAPEPR